jgi:hypothetical protein
MVEGKRPRSAAEVQLPAHGQLQLKSADESFFARAPSKCLWLSSTDAFTAKIDLNPLEKIENGWQKTTGLSFLLSTWVLYRDD